MSNPKQYNVSVWSPQHSPVAYPKHLAFNFENKGWVWNKNKECYEIWIKQNGYFSEEDFCFHPTDNKKGSHSIAFYTKEAFDDWQSNWQKQLIK